MNMENQRNWDELRDSTFADTTAQVIFKYLDALEKNREGMHTRWIWELLQNAHDASIDANMPLIASIEHGKGYLVFRHNGRGFSDKEITRLIHHGSTKVETDEAIGKFGSGFLTTHLLSSEIDVSGQLDTGQPFKFRLKREASSVEALRDSMNGSWEDFKHSLLSPRTEPLPNDFTTHFRYPIRDGKVDAVKCGITILKRCAPFVIVFNPNFSSIDIKLPNETVSFKATKRASLAQVGLQEITVSENGKENSKDKVYLLAKGKKTSVAIPLELSMDDGRVCLPVEILSNVVDGFRTHPW